MTFFDHTSVQLLRTSDDSIELTGIAALRTVYEMRWHSCYLQPSRKDTEITATVAPDAAPIRRRVSPVLNPLTTRIHCGRPHVSRHPLLFFEW